MRIPKQKKNKSNIKLIIRLFGLFIISSLLIIAYKSIPKSISFDSDYFCDGEEYTEGGFNSNGILFTTNCFQDTKEYVSGKASCRCEGDKRYGPTLSLNGLSPGDTVFMSLQVKSTKNSKSKLVLSSDKEHFHQELISNGGDGEWKEYRSYYIIPEGSEGATWKVYPIMAEGDGPAYFDDFRVDLQGSNIKTNSSIDFPLVELQINELNFRKIAAKRKKAKEIGLLYSSKNDLVEADIKVDGKEYSCLTRLKGDLLDHLRSDKWSFRIVLDGNETWRGMNVFSIHNSKARSHLAEWTMHQIMRLEGIISPKYDFMQFVLNSKNIGIYAYEQHFDNHFLDENKNGLALF